MRGFNIQNNYESGNASVTQINTNNNCNVNNADSWVEAIEEIKKLYERLLIAEKDKVDLMQNILDNLNEL